MKEQSLDFEIARDFFIEMKSSVLSENIVSMFDFVILDIDLALSRSCLWSWDYSAHALREKCQYSKLFWSIFSSIWSVFNPECGKMGTRIRPKTDTFHAVMYCVMLLCFWKKLLLLACFVVIKFAVFM